MEQQTERPFAVPNQSGHGKYNLYSVWFNALSRKFLWTFGATCVLIDKYTDLNNSISTQIRLDLPFYNDFERNKIGKYNLNSVWFNAISVRFLRVLGNKSHFDTTVGYFISRKCLSNVSCCLHKNLTRQPSVRASEANSTSKDNEWEKRTLTTNIPTHLLGFIYKWVVRWLIIYRIFNHSVKYERAKQTNEKSERRFFLEFSTFQLSIRKRKLNIDAF